MCTIMLLYGEPKGFDLLLSGDVQTNGRPGMKCPIHFISRYSFWVVPAWNKICSRADGPVGTASLVEDRTYDNAMDWSPQV